MLVLLLFAGKIIHIYYGLNGYVCNLCAGAQFKLSKTNTFELLNLWPKDGVVAKITELIRRAEEVAQHQRATEQFIQGDMC